MTTLKPNISILIPMYNEEKTVAQLLLRLYDVFVHSAYTFQIVVVDDGSTDNSVKVAQDVLDTFEQGSHTLHVSKKNQGKGAAIRLAINLALGEYTVIQDADLEYDPFDLLVMMQQIEKQQLDVLYGSRFLNKKNKHSSKLFYLGGRFVSLVTNLLYRQHLTDEPTCYKMFRTSLLKSIPLNCTGFEFCPEVTAKVAKRGVKIMEIPIGYYPRSIANGKKITPFDGVEAIVVLLKYRFCN